MDYAKALLSLYSEKDGQVSLSDEGNKRYADAMKKLSEDYFDDLSRHCTVRYLPRTENISSSQLKAEIRRATPAPALDASVPVRLSVAEFMGIEVLPPDSIERTQVGKAKRVIFLQLNGGMSHIDTFDPKTGVQTASIQLGGGAPFVQRNAGPPRQFQFGLAYKF